MQKGIFHIIPLLISALIIGGLNSLVDAQYYFFDAPSASNYPYQQGCSEQLLIKATTENNLTGATAGLLRMQFDPTHFSYFTGDTASGLQNYLFNANAAAFFQYTNPTLSPIRISGSNHTLLGIDRINGGTAFKGTGLYGTVLFIPVYSPTPYTGYFSFIYDGDTVKTSLSYAGSNIINSTHQNAFMTGQFYVYQQPCVDDTIAPATSIVIPSAGTKKSHLSGVHLSLTDTVGDTNVPYVRTGDLPNLGTWTGNDRSLNNQYGIHLSTFNIRISGNGTGRYYSGSMFSSAGDLAAIASGKTRQFRDRNYAIDIDPSMIFDFGIEKPITISGTVRDRNNNLASFTRTVNAPVSPRLIAGSATPAANASAVLATDPIILAIADDRAGVNSGSITVTLSGINGTDYGPYTFSGTSLNLSGIIGSALQPDYSITIDNHVDFPTSGTIHVHVYALDMAGTTDAINDYTFTTKPSCLDLGCCGILFQTGINPPFTYTHTGVTISGGINPSFILDGSTGTLDCGMDDQGMTIYKGTEQNSGSATLVGFFGGSELIFSGNSSGVKATLSGNTVYLQKTYVPPLCITNCGGGGGGGGGGGHLVQDDCELPSALACANDEGIDNSYGYYDNTCCANEGHAVAPSCDVSDSTYETELTDAFSRGYGLNITNKCPISDARLDSYIIRKELAKMMTLFTIQVIGIYPDTDKAGCDSFDDVADLNEEMKFYTKTACQLDLMGLESDGKTPKKSFDPEDYVDRAQFGTILSRLVYGDVYNVYTGEELKYKRYEKHLRALYEDNIMKKIQDPFLRERRGRVLLMLKRTVDESLVEQYHLVTPVHNGAISLLENVW